MLKRYSFLIGATDPFIVLPIGLGQGGWRQGGRLCAGHLRRPHFSGDGGRRRPGGQGGRSFLAHREGNQRDRHALQSAGQRSEGDLPGVSRDGRDAVGAAGSRKDPGAMRSVGEGNWRRRCAVASMGEYHSAAAEPDADADTKPHADRVAVAVPSGNAGRACSVADFDFCISAGDSDGFAAGEVRDAPLEPTGSAIEWIRTSQAIRPRPQTRLSSCLSTA